MTFHETQELLQPLYGILSVYGPTVFYLILIIFTLEHILELRYKGESIIDKLAKRVPEKDINNYIIFLLVLFINYFIFMVSVYGILPSILAFPIVSIPTFIFLTYFFLVRRPYLKAKKAIKEV